MSFAEPTLSDKTSHVPQLEELEVIERGVVSLMETAMHALAGLSSLDTVNQEDVENQCHDYLSLLEVRLLSLSIPHPPMSFQSVYRLITHIFCLYIFCSKYEMH